MKVNTLLKIAAASLLIFSGAASATIAGSLHDLSSTNTDPAAGLTLDGLCIYCHAPHNAQLAAAPLWNRNDSQETFTMYNVTNTGSNTLNMTVSGAPGPFSAACLSCHDGATALDALINTPYGYVTASTGNKTTWGSVGTDLTNDHPISIAYDTALDPEFNAIVDNAVGGLPLFGASDTVECASCHDVHDQDTYFPFLRADNAGSLLCLTCHIK